MNKPIALAALGGICAGVAITLVPLGVAEGVGEASSKPCGGNGQFHAVTERFTDYQAIGVFVVDSCTGTVVKASRFDYSTLQKE